MTRTAVLDEEDGLNWSHVQDGRITRIRVAFDPRAIVGDAS